MKSKILIVAILILSGCTQQERARSFGGTATTNLPAGEKLVTVTWKETDLWLLTRPMKDTEQPETYHFREDSTWDVMEGTVVIKESR